MGDDATAGRDRVDVAVDDGVAGRVDAGTVEREARRVLSALALAEPAELSVLLVDDARMRQLNREWRDLDRPTDVLSFPQQTGDVAGGTLGDVVIDMDQLARQATEHGMEAADELRFVLIHALLHLLGHDHHRDDERAAMEAEEQRLWTKLGGVGRIR